MSPLLAELFAEGCWKNLSELEKAELQNNAMYELQC